MTSTKRQKLMCEVCNGDHWRKDCPHNNPNAEPLVRSIELVILIMAWRSRAQQCRDEAHDNTDWENPGTAPNRLLLREKASMELEKGNRSNG